LGLGDIHTRKPLIDGKVICQMFDVKPGKIMKPLTEEVMKFQILNPLADEA
jgi:tRNA nucleotidyltransferase (CCA-adding enzyme)